jgi:hypothetical protein
MDDAHRQTLTRTPRRERAPGLARNRAQFSASPQSTLFPHEFSFFCGALREAWDEVRRGGPYDLDSPSGREASRIIALTLLVAIRRMAGEARAEQSDLGTPYVIPTYRPAGAGDAEGSETFDQNQIVRPRSQNHRRKARAAAFVSRDRGFEQCPSRP